MNSSRRRITLSTVALAAAWSCSSWPGARADDDLNGEIDGFFGEHIASLGTRAVERLDSPMEVTCMAGQLKSRRTLSSAERRESITAYPQASFEAFFNAVKGVNASRVLYASLPLCSNVYESSRTSRLNNRTGDTPGKILFRPILECALALRSAGRAC